MARVIQRFVLPYMTGYTTDNGAEGVVLIATDWRPFKGGGTARGWVEFSGELGNAGVAVGLQKTNDPTGTGGTPTRVCAFVTSKGVGNPDATPTPVDLDGENWVRAVDQLRSTDGNLAGGAFRGVVEILD